MRSKGVKILLMDMLRVRFFIILLEFDLKSNRGDPGAVEASAESIANLQKPRVGTGVDFEKNVQTLDRWRRGRSRLPPVYVDAYSICLSALHALENEDDHKAVEATMGRIKSLAAHIIR